MIFMLICLLTDTSHYKLTVYDLNGNLLKDSTCTKVDFNTMVQGGERLAAYPGVIYFRRKDNKFYYLKRTEPRWSGFDWKKGKQ